jgi:hypothetical protein
MADDALRPGERVIATVDLPGVAEGIEGRVTLVVGLSWIRYWVRFDNGVDLGSIHRDKLARPKEYGEILQKRARAAEAAAAAGEAGGPAEPGEEEAPAAAEAPAPAGGLASRVPAHLLERSRQARAKAGA